VPLVVTRLSTYAQGVFEVPEVCTRWLTHALAKYKVADVCLGDYKVTKLCSRYPRYTRSVPEVCS
jgi:hypothetical protein